MTATMPAELRLSLPPLAARRGFQIQCKREKPITPKRISEYLEEMIPSGATVPHGVILAAPCDFSKKARDSFKDVLRRRGVREFYLWGKGDIEDLLYRPQNDHLLYAYFGISLQGERPSFRYRCAARGQQIARMDNDAESLTARIPLITARYTFTIKTEKTSNMSGSSSILRAHFHLLD
jgi:hypothetical protein